MSGKSIHLFLVILVLDCAGGAFGAEPYQQDTGPDGIVSIEAEHYDDKVAGANGDEWVEVEATGVFTGVAGMQAQPDDNTGSRNEDYAARSPRLDYQVAFVKTGTYYVWILAAGDDGYSDSCHAGLDGEEIDTCDRMSGWNGTYQWSNDTVDSVPSSFDVTSTGVHTVNVWMREDGLIVDKIVLTSNPDYVLEETEAGPDESSRGARLTASGASPSDAATDVPRDTVLSWSSGESAATHDVYFGTVFDDVNMATRANPLGVLVSQGQDANSYVPKQVLAFEQTYYWRIDEVNAAPDNTIFPGSVWSFTVEPVAYAIEDITATASSSMAGFDPQSTVDGSGLDANDLHSDDMDAMWVTALGAEVPGWIQYEFDRVCKLYELHVWNYNVSLEMVLGYGFKDVTIEYSEDGVEWTVFGDVEFARGPSSDGYASNTTVDLAGIAARFVRLTANDNWGTMSQYGLSEVRLTYLPVYPREPMPDSGAEAVSVHRVLSWRAGREAVTHEVYLGTDEAAVDDGAAGADIWDAADEFRLVYKRLTGDASIIARVDSVVEIDPWTKAGVMIRESLSEGAKFAAVYITPGNGCRFHARLASLSDATSDTDVATDEQIAITAPYWVKLERSGNEFSGFYSADGVNWTTMVWSPQTVSMLGSVYIGLAVTSHSEGNPTVAEFSQVGTKGNVTGSWTVEAIGVD